MSGRDFHKLSSKYHSGKISAEDVVKELVKRNDFDSGRKKIAKTATWQVKRHRELLVSK